MQTIVTLEKTTEVNVSHFNIYIKNIIPKKTKT